MTQEVLKLALAFIEAEGWGDSEVVITTINQALAQPAQRTWVGLTDEDIRQCSRDVVAGGPENSVDRFAYAIEAKLKEKNT